MSKNDKQQGIPFGDKQGTHGVIIDTPLGQRKYFLQERLFTITGKNYVDTGDRSVPWNE